MKAIVQDRYGSPDVLQLRDIDQPVIGDDGVLVRVRAASANALDWHRLRGEPFLVRTSEGLRRPSNRATGHDVAGEVEAVGKAVTLLKAGDAVFGTRVGAFAEFVAGREANFVTKPAGLTFEEAAAIPIAATTALQGLRDKGQVQAGQKVLIVGAGGGVGTFAVQIARALGAEVTGVTTTRNVELVRSIGANDVIDYTREDFTRRGRRFDLILDMAGTQSLLACSRALTPTGRYVIVGGPGGRWLRPMDRILKAALLARLVRRQLLPFLASIKRDDLLVLKGLAEDGKLAPVIDRTYPLGETAEAIRYLETGHVRGKVVITVRG